MDKALNRKSIIHNRSWHVIKCTRFMFMWQQTIVIAVRTNEYIRTYIHLCFKSTKENKKQKTENRKRTIAQIPAFDSILHVEMELWKGILVACLAMW